MPKIKVVITVKVDRERIEELNRKQREESGYGWDLRDLAIVVAQELGINSSDIAVTEHPESA